MALLTHIVMAPQLAPEDDGRLMMSEWEEENSAQ